MSAASGLAARYRPRRLDDVVGQRHATAVLRAALRSDRLPHQLLFSGGSGLGKTTLARIAAAALLCGQRDDGDACGTCPSCVDVAAGTHPDVVEVDAASHGGKDEVRDIAARASVLPAVGSHKVYIIDEAHGLSKAGGEAFLKLLEEPPAHVVFMLATTDPDKMSRANRGRCVEFALRRPPAEALAGHLMVVASAEGVTLGAGDAAAVVDSVDPALGVRGALMALEQVLALTAVGVGAPEAIAAALGLPPASVVAAVTDAIADGNPARAVAALAQARVVADDAVLRQALLRWAHDRLVAAADAGDVEVRYAVLVLEALVAPVTRPADFDVAVCRAAAPVLDATPDALVAAAARAEKAADRLAAACATADGVSAATGPASAPAPSPAPGGAAKSRAATADDAGAPGGGASAGPAPRRRRTKAAAPTADMPELAPDGPVPGQPDQPAEPDKPTRPAKPAQPAPAVDADPFADAQPVAAAAAAEVLRIVGLVQATSRVAAAALSSADVSVTEQTVVVAANHVVADRLERHRKLIEQASGRRLVISGADADAVFKTVEDAQ